MPAHLPNMAAVRNLTAERPARKQHRDALASATRRPGPRQDQARQRAVYRFSGHQRPRAELSAQSLGKGRQAMYQVLHVALAGTIAIVLIVHREPHLPENVLTTEQVQEVGPACVLSGVVPADYRVLDQ